MSRRYILDVLFWEREESGRPIFPAEPKQDGIPYLYELACRRGLPHPQAMAWARREMKKFGPDRSKRG